ncbi:MAG: DUF1320 domain-containing protein [Glaciimonas sp.]|nr:DUF1320 domain-containing protein [Glaciimonas sp.]
MNYCTVTAFGLDDIVALPNRQNVQATIVGEVVAQQAIVQAEVEINVYLEGRYPMPLVSAPMILKQIAVDIARFYLYTRIDEDHPQQVNPTADVSKLLEGIATGRLSLGLDAANKVVTPLDTVQIAAGRHDFGGHQW